MEKKRKKKLKCGNYSWYAGSCIIYKEDFFVENPIELDLLG
jgi:hypothetical protein